MSMVKKETEKTVQTGMRPPIVVVLGHVDHGKTTLLDTIRKTNVVAKESGGITQHIGAYQAEHAGKKITFIDTPGHEAFGQMRSRGATVADIAVVVVAAEEGVKPQTEEALAIVQRAGIPYIVALNKIDKPGANIEKVKRELAEKGVLLEGWGGDVSNIPISAKHGDGISDLLDTILLLAEIHELKGDAEASAGGVVIEAHKDARKGIIATLLVRDGSLHVGDITVVGSSWGRIRSMEDFIGKAIEKAGPSVPVVVSGMSEVPDVGETFTVVRTDSEAQELAGKEQERRKFAQRIGGANVEVTRKIIVRTDVVGSLEAIVGSFEKLSSTIVALDIVSAATGAIGENEVKTAAASGAVIIAFKVKVPSAIQQLADRMQVTIIAADIIYELIDAVRADMEAAVPPEIIRTDLGTVKILATFKQEGIKQIIGGEVTKGTIKPKTLIEIERAGHLMGHGKLTSVQMNKIEVDEVPQNKQCGIQIELKGVSVLPGDVLKCYTEERKMRPLL